jgi:hypothetical protein
MTHSQLVKIGSITTASWMNHYAKDAVFERSSVLVNQSGLTAPKRWVGVEDVIERTGRKKGRRSA